MDPTVLRHACDIIEHADRQHLADDLLRSWRTATGRTATSVECAEVSHAVFAYFRWRGWLDDATGLAEKLKRAWSLAETFAANPRGLPEADLVKRAVPNWLREEMAIGAEWVRALQTPPRLWLRARPGQGRALAAKLGLCRIFGEGCWEDTLEYQGRLDLFRTPEFHTGQFELQDLNSQAVGLLCQPQPGETWWDACAGEGGKLLHLSDLMKNQGLIWASDRAAWRLRKLKRRTARARVFNYRAAAWEGGPRLPTKTKFDGVLLDAPCSGVGTWHRNPQARWTTTPQDVKELSALQQQLLAHAAAAVKPGGKLVYAVCTLTRSETVTVTEAFQTQFPQFEPYTLQNLLAPRLPAASQLTLLPQDHGGNGMFVAAWRRRGLLEKEA